MAQMFQPVTRNSLVYEAENLFSSLLGIRDEEVQQVHTTVVNQTEQLRQVGERIGDLCDRLERTPEGQEIIRLANEINVEEVTEEGLQEVIKGIFGFGEGEGALGGGGDNPGKGGGWWIRIIALFSFCKNLFIRGYRAVVNVCKTIVRNITNIVSDCFSWIDSFFRRLM